MMKDKTPSGVYDLDRLLKEQELIVKYSTINKGYYNFNLINGINPMNPNYDKYMNAILTIDESETYVGENIEWDQNK